jgi:acyl carrier protein
MLEIKAEIIDIVKDADRSVVISSDEDFERSFSEIGLDSLDLMSVLFAIQERFGIEIPDDDVDKLTSLSILSSYIEERLLDEGTGDD